MDALEKAESLDAMERDVSSKEADFLENVLKRLRAGGSLTPKQLKSLDEMYVKYLGVSEEEDEDEEGSDDFKIDDSIDTDSGTAD